MENYSIYDDFTHYIEENKEIITFLEENNSLLNDYTEPIIRTLTYLKLQQEIEEEDVVTEDRDIFSYGFEYLFENVEQMKLYLKALEEDYFAFEQNSYYIKMVFQFEELKVEIQKRANEQEEDHDQELEAIDQALQFFEALIAIEERPFDKKEMDAHLKTFDDLYQRYDDIVLLSDAFNHYCATYGL